MVLASSATAPISVENIKLNCLISVQLLVPLTAQVILFSSINFFSPSKSSLESKASMSANNLSAAALFPLAIKVSACPSIK